MTTGGADDPDQLIAVAAGELLMGLADRALPTGSPRRCGYPVRLAEFFNGPARSDGRVTATHIAERIAALLDGDRGRP